MLRSEWEGRELKCHSKFGNFPQNVHVLALAQRSFLNRQVAVSRVFLVSEPGIYGR